MATRRPRKITHGQVRRPGEKNVMAVAVDELLEWKDLDGWTLTVKDVPRTPYVKNEEIVYEDGNNNNTAYFTVSSVVGPAKYKLATG